MTYQTLVYAVDGAIASITLNRPKELNTIVPPMPDEIEAAVAEAVRDDKVKVIVFRGAGRALCGGFNFGGGFHHWDSSITTDGAWDPGKDFVFSTRAGPGTDPEVHGVLALPEAGDRAGARVVRGRRQRLHARVRSGDRERGCAHRHAVRADVGRIPERHVDLPARVDEGEGARTGKPLSGKEAAACGLINEAVPFAKLEERVWQLAEQLATIPLSQLCAQKLIVNQAYENMGLHSTQMLGPILDGLMRNTPDARRWIEVVGKQGVKAAVIERDGPWGDYSQAPAHERPDPYNVVPLATPRSR